MKRRVPPDKLDILNPVLQEALWIKIKICFMDADSNDILNRKRSF